MRWLEPRRGWLAPLGRCLSGGRGLERLRRPLRRVGAHARLHPRWRRRLRADALHRLRRRGLGDARFAPLGGELRVSLPALVVVLLVVEGGGRGSRNVRQHRRLARREGRRARRASRHPLRGVVGLVLGEGHLDRDVAVLEPRLERRVELGDRALPKRRRLHPRRSAGRCAAARCAHVLALDAAGRGRGAPVDARDLTAAQRGWHRRMDVIGHTDEPHGGARGWGRRRGSENRVLFGQTHRGGVVCRKRALR